MKINAIKAAIAVKALAVNADPAQGSKEMPRPSAAKSPILATPSRPMEPPRASQAVAIAQMACPAPDPDGPVPAPQEQKPGRKTSTTGTRKRGKAAASDIETVVAEHLRPGIDFNVIPGCGRKPSLLKAGAEHLASVLGYRTSSEVSHRVQELDRSFVLYEVATTVRDAEGNVIAVGLGSCNTLERKFAKQGFAASLNTVLKMARKRSYVDAILSATGSSRLFTQDIEEMMAIGASVQDPLQREA